MKACDAVARGLFTFFLVLSMAPVFMGCCLGRLIVGLLPSSCEARASDELAGVLIRLTCLAWRMTIMLSCWIRVETQGAEDFFAALRVRRPRCLIGNHLSFLDTIVLVSLAPVLQANAFRVLVSSHIMRLPVLGFMIRSMGMVEVPFKNARDESDWSCDEEAMSVSFQRLEAHLWRGGVAAWYPEGLMNRDDGKQVGFFRAGGFAMPVKGDCEIWGAALVGTSHCWPRKSPLGGSPARIQCKFFKICDSSLACVEAAGLKGNDNERERCIYLANHARQKMQVAVSQLFAERDSSQRLPPVDTAAVSVAAAIGESKVSHRNLAASGKK